MELSLTNTSAALVLVQKETREEFGQFDPKLIPLDHTHIALTCDATLRRQESEDPQSFAFLRWDAARKVWLIASTGVPPNILVNGEKVSGERDLGTNDTIKLENEEVKSLSYRFHWPTNACASQLMNSKTTVSFATFSPVCRKRQRSESASEDVNDPKGEKRRNNGQQIESSASQYSSKTREVSSKTDPCGYHLAELRREHTCTICTDLFYKTMTLECGHSFCKDCIDKWLACSLSCPICREVTKKPPFASLVSDKSVEVLISSDKLLKEAYEKKKELSLARLKKSRAAQIELNRLILFTKKSGHKLLCIANPWSEREQLRFFKGVVGHYGPSREAFCASISLTHDFIERAERGELLVALRNLSLKPADYKKDSDVDVSSVWSAMRTQELRTRLLMFVYWS